MKKKIWTAMLSMTLIFSSLSGTVVAAETGDTAEQSMPTQEMTSEETAFSEQEDNASNEQEGVIETDGSETIVTNSAEEDTSKETEDQESVNEEAETEETDQNDSQKIGQEEEVSSDTAETEINEDEIFSDESESLEEIDEAEPAGTCANGIYGNGTGGISIDINAEPYTNDAWWNYGTPYQSTGCTWFVGARVMQLTGKGGYNTQDPSYWYTGYGESLGFTKGTELKAPCVACYSNHVRIIEKVEGETATISEGGLLYDKNSSAFNNNPGSYGYCMIRQRSIYDIPNMDSGFLGYVYLGRTDPMNIGDSFTAAFLKSDSWTNLVVNGDNVELGSHSVEATARGQWKFTRQSDNSYIIESLYDGRVLDVSNADSADGTNVQVYTKWGTDNGAQKWYIFGNSTAYELAPKMATLKRLDVSTNSDALGTNIQIWSANGSTAQTFSIYKFTDKGPYEGGYTVVDGPGVCNVGETVQSMTFNFNSDVTRWKTINYQSSDPSIATVDSDGKVTGLKSGTVTITGTSAYNDRLSHSVQISIEEALPEIITGPESVAVKAGAEIVFNVSATGNGLTYQWQYQGKTSTVWKDFANANEAQMTKTAAKSWNGWKVRCVVTDNDGDTVVSDSAMITIIEPITITVQPQPVTADANDSVTFTIEAESYDGSALAYQWQYQGKTSTNWNNFTNASLSSMTKTANNSWNGWKIRCLVRDVSGNTLASNTALLTVTGPIDITRQPASIETATKRTVTFTVVAESRDGSALTYQWQYQGKTSSKWNNFVNATSSSLTKTAAQSWDGWKIRCIIKDSHGNSVTSNSVVLTVHDPITITMHPEEVLSPAGKKTTFAVEAESYDGSSLTYQWQYQGKTTTAWNNFAGATEKTMTKALQSGWNGWKIRCLVKDAFGNNLASNIALIKIGVPINITSQPASVTTKAGTDVTFAIEAESSTGEELMYQWQYQGATGTSWNNFAWANTATIIKNVKYSWNGWKIRCIITDESGNSLTSEQAVITVE